MPGAAANHDAELAIEAEGLVKTFGEPAPSTAWTSRFRAAPCTACSGPTAPARPPRSACSPRCCAPTRGARGCSATTSSTEADTVRGLVSLTGQLASVDEDLTGEREPHPARPAARLPAAPARGARRRAARARSSSARPPSKQVKNYSGRHAPAARHRGEHRRDARAACSSTSRRPAWTRGRATRCGTSSARSPPGHDRPALHPVPRRGRPARRPHRGHRPGHVIAEGTPAQLKASVGQGALHVRLLDPEQRAEAERVLARALDAPVQPSPTRPRCRRRRRRRRARRGASPSSARAGIGVADFSLGQPSLDEVFLALTGRPAEDERRRGGGGMSTDAARAPAEPHRRDGCTPRCRRRRARRARAR